MVSFTYEDIYEYDIKLYLFVKEKYGLDEKAWRLFMNSYIDPDEYALKSLKYKVQGISSCTADSLLSVKRIHAHEGFGDNFIETFKKYRQTPIFFFPSETNGINTSRMKYLEDRIDHTLFDLKRYCEGEENCKLKIAFEGSKTKKWIDSFGKKFNKIVESMGIVGIFVNENYEVYDLEKCDNTLLTELQDNYLNPRNKGYLSSWTERYYKNVKNKIDDFLNMIAAQSPLL